MKAEELRIGNYVKIDAGIAKVVSLIENNYCKENANDGYNITVKLEEGIFREREEEEDKVEGIPLTEEILLNCGFEYINNDNKEAGLISPTDALGARFRIIHFDNDFRMILNTWNYLPIKYVHKFQNLFFALSGKELNIQL